MGALCIGIAGTVLSIIVSIVRMPDKSSEQWQLTHVPCHDSVHRVDDNNPNAHCRADQFPVIQHEDYGALVHCACNPPRE